MFSQRAIVPLLLWMICVGIANGGEIVISPAANNRADDAAALRNKARGYKSGIVPSSGVPVIYPDAANEDEEGVLSPRVGDVPATFRTGPQESARDNIPAVQDGQPMGNDAVPADVQEEMRARLEENRLKANRYMRGKPAPSVVSRNTGDPVVVCGNSGNVVGRIGDDSMSGKEIIVMRDGVPVKMRCK